MEQVILSLAASADPLGKIEADFHDAVNDLIDRMRDFGAIRLTEVARLAYLPWGGGGQPVVSADVSAAHVELVALIALAARISGDSGGDQKMSHFVSGAKEDLNNLLYQSQVRAIAATNPSDKLAMVSMLVRGSEVWLRNTSYPDRAEATVRDLLDGCPDVRQELITSLGFSGGEALAVLEACHDLQQDNMNSRMQEMVQAMNEAGASVIGGTLDPIVRDATRAKFNAAWEPEVEAATVGIDQLVASTGLPEDRVLAIVDQFRLNVGATTPAQIVDDFMAGKNPLRTHPLLVSDCGRVMLPHHALTGGAIKHNLEQHLKSTTAWDAYADHRGHLLETRTRAALEKVLLGAHFRDGFEYYVPDSPKELATGDPTRYTKRVEGDHLIILDDVAVIVEDKAVALSALSRGGKVNRIRTDLTNIITKAAVQAGRLRDAIERDHGVRIDGEGWVDLRHIREIHTIAVSLDDLSGVATATAELVKAGLLERSNICWTVSLHDLELITELVDRPAEFLLYLRRRRNPDATVLYSAPDELDLFLYFFESGLWVEPDPDQIRITYPYLPEPTPGQRRRHRKQTRAIIASRTDQLDHWYYAKNGNGPEVIPKPTMTGTPLIPFVDSLRERGDYGWLSIGATLLAGATAAQARMAGVAKKLLDNPRADGRGRSLTMPLISSPDPAEGWLLVWVTRPPGQDPASFEKDSTDYLRVKMHQLSLTRGAVFLYDESTREFWGSRYSGQRDPLPDALKARLSQLEPPEAVQHRLPSPAKRKKKQRSRARK
ncbi:hypothetical protein [Amycolatopsis decaplanina]|uniref:hypothetical protein n=1 Tax=Amycolatopsis decaplanina TaxID=208441 RepID=UPI000A052799|nr:hypothetical protein [Amycolatopsis decaplanina]